MGVVVEWDMGESDLVDGGRRWQLDQGGMGWWKLQGRQFTIDLSARMRCCGPPTPRRPRYAPFLASCRDTWILLRMACLCKVPVRD